MASLAVLTGLGFATSAAHATAVPTNAATQTANSILCLNWLGLKGWGFCV
jgi:hypothetical protein